jgi:hypothetical protein
MNRTLSFLVASLALVAGPAAAQAPAQPQESAPAPGPRLNLNLNLDDARSRPRITFGERGEGKDKPVADTLPALGGGSSITFEGPPGFTPLDAKRNSPFPKDAEAVRDR